MLKSQKTTQMLFIQMLVKKSTELTWDIKQAKSMQST